LLKGSSNRKYNNLKGETMNIYAHPIRNLGKTTLWLCCAYPN